MFCPVRAAVGTRFQGISGSVCELCRHEAGLDGLFN